MNRQPHIVVIAEDETLLRMLAAEALVDAGFEVFEAEHAAAALNILQSQGAAVAVLFTDVQMPGAMNGLQLAHHVRGRWPEIGLLVVSGQPAPTAATLPQGSRFLAKPYQLDQIVTYVQELAAPR